VSSSYDIILYFEVPFILLLRVEHLLLIIHVSNVPRLE